MIWIDFGIIGLLASTLAIGLFKGFRQQAFTALIWIITILVGIFFSKDFAWFLLPSISDPISRIAGAFVVLCLITQIIGSLIAMLLRPLLKKSRLTLADRLGGMLLGLLQGSFFMVVILLLAGLSVLPKTPWWKQSKLIPPFQLVTVWVCNNARSDLTQNVHYN